jgi:hypothetical protein
MPNGRDAKDGLEQGPSTPSSVHQKVPRVRLGLDCIANDNPSQASDLAQPLHPLPLPSDSAEKMAYIVTMFTRTTLATQVAAVGLEPRASGTVIEQSGTAPRRKSS